MLWGGALVGVLRPPIDVLMIMIMGVIVPVRGMMVGVVLALGAGMGRATVVDVGGGAVVLLTHIVIGLELLQRAARFCRQCEQGVRGTQLRSCAGQPLFFARCLRGMLEADEVVCGTLQGDLQPVVLYHHVKLAHAMLVNLLWRGPGGRGEAERSGDAEQGVGMWSERP